MDYLDLYTGPSTTARPETHGAWGYNIYVHKGGNWSVNGDQQAQYVRFLEQGATITILKGARVFVRQTRFLMASSCSHLILGQSCLT